MRGRSPFAPGCCAPLSAAPAATDASQGPVQPVHFPVPWARMPSMSFLRPPAEVRTLIADSGFAELTWLDVSKPSLAWIQRRQAKAPATPPPLGLHLLFGPVIGVMFQNLARNLEEHRIAVIEAVFARA